MVKTLLGIVIAAFVFAAASNAAVDDIAATVWSIDGKLEVRLRGGERSKEMVQVPLEFAHATDWWHNMWPEHFRYHVPRNPTLILDGDYDYLPSREILLDPAEGNFSIYAWTTFGEAVSAVLKRKLHVSSLDRVDTEVVVLEVTGQVVNMGSGDEIRTGFKVLHRYVGWSGQRHASTWLQIRFDGRGGLE